MSKKNTPKQPVAVRIAKIRKKLRAQLKELTHALEFYINKRQEYLTSEIERVRQAIIRVQEQILYPSLY